MSISKSVRWILALGSLAVVPIYAQSTATAANQTMGTNPTASNPTATTTSKTTTTTTTTPKTHHRKHSAGSSKSAVWRDASRLGAVLEDTQTNASVPAATWTSVGNEANVLANRIYSHTGGNATARKAATDLRRHVRLMRTAAKSGDAAGAKQHASEALPYANQLADWAAPAKM